MVYLPPGRYLVSDTLVLLFYTHLVGNHRCPPTIVLKPSAPGYTNRSAGLKPVIAAGNGFNTSLHDWWDDSENMAFYSQILHLRVEVGAGNVAATGILWGIAQQTTIRNTVIEAGPAAVGLDVSGRSHYTKKPGGVGYGGGGGCGCRGRGGAARAEGCGAGGSGQRVVQRFVLAEECAEKAG